MKELVELFTIFIKLGLITFGGGYAMIPVLEREIIGKKGWVTMDEVMDYYTIAQITPGIIAVNVSTFIGCKQKGPLGGVVSTVGFILPGVTLIIIIASLISGFADIPVVQHAFAGIRVAVAALILDTVIKLIKGVFKNWKSCVIYAAALALSLFLNVNPVFIVLGAGLAGVLFFRPKAAGAADGAGKGGVA